MVAFTGGTEDCIKAWYAGSKEKPENLKCIGSFTNESQGIQERSGEL